MLRLDTGERRGLIEGGTYARYVSSEPGSPERTGRQGGLASPKLGEGGHLVFERAGALLAVPFDLETLSTKGAAASALEGVINSASGAAQFAVSQTGTLAYVLASAVEGGRSLVWVDRQGGVQPVPTPPQNFGHPRLSPDGQRLAVDIRLSGGNATTDIWLYQFVRGTLSRLSFARSEAEAPIWTPDGKRVTYTVALLGQPPRAIVWKPADNSGPEEVLATGDAHLHLKSWSPGGDVLVASEGLALAGSADIWTLLVKDKRALRPLAKTPFAEAAPALSPDGRWMAYASNETGRFEVYAQAFPGPGGKWQISTDGGSEPVWARSGRELFYRNGDKMMAVTIDASGAALTAGKQTLLFQGRFSVAPGADQWYDVSPDGKRFIMLKSADTARSTPAITIVQEWSTELTRIAPAKP